MVFLNLFIAFFGVLTLVLADDFQASETWGGTGGTEFNDNHYIAAGTKITELSANGAKVLDGIGYNLSNGQKFWHGGHGGDFHKITLASDEFFQKMKVCREMYKGKIRIFYAKLETTKGQSFEAGTSTNDCYDFLRIDGRVLGGFCGKAGRTVDRLGVVYVPSVKI